MDPCLSARPLGASHGRLGRLAGAAAAALFLLALPSPAAAAPTPTVTITDVTVTEGSGGITNANVTIQVAPHPKPCCSLQVSWATAPGSAKAPADFTASSGTVTLTKTAFARVVSVPVVGDTTDEPNETFFVNLTNLVGSPGQIGDPQGLATIVDNDQPPTLSVDDVAVAEGDAGTSTATFTASLSAVSGMAVTLDWATSVGSATAGVDYAAAGGSRTIPPGSTGASIGVIVNGDVLDEPDESFGITLSNPGNATIADGSGQATIADDDPLPLVGIGDVTLPEGHVGSSTATFDVTLSPASGRTVTVGWATADDGATQPGDYVAASGTVTFTPGDTSETIGVTVNGDVLAELDESFQVVLAGPSNAQIGDGQGLGTIEDDEFLPVIDIDEPSVAEGQTGTSTLSFTVSLSNASVSTVTVDWTSADGTAAGADYVPANGTVTFAPLDTSETVEVTVNGDGTFEPDETFSVDLSNANGGAPIGDAQGIGTIANDDAAPVLSIGDAAVAEGNSGTALLTFTVTLAGDTDVAASVDYDTAPTTATEGTDYVGATGTITIPAGETSATRSVVLNGDLTFETNETFSVNLSNPSGGVIGDGVGRGTIVNDDKARTTLTLAVARKPKSLIARGLLEPTTTGHRVTATLYRKVNGRFVKLAAKTVRVRYVRDRDSDGWKDGSYSATFLRPRPAGSYKVLVRFRGTATHKPCSRARVFTLVAT